MSNTQLRKVVFGEQRGTFKRFNNTTWLQLLSLDSFAYELGYTRETGRFYNPDSKERMYLSFKTMCTLHNNNFVTSPYTTTWEDVTLKIPMRVARDYRGVFTSEQMGNAVDKKIVRTAKLEYSKKTRVIITNEHEVEFK